MLYVGHSIGLDDDQDLVDLPRYTSAKSAIKDLHDASDTKVFMVYTKMSVNKGMCNPHFVILKNKLPGADTYRDFVCTCGSSVTTGVPCRHYWSVYCESGSCAFHQGLVNDLWFREAQPLRQDIKLFTCDKIENRSFVHTRPLSAIASPNEDDCYDTQNIVL